MSRSSISMDVLENDEESLVGTGAHRRLFNDPISQHPSSTPQDYWTYTELLRGHVHYSGYCSIPPNGPSDVTQLRYANVDPMNATTGFPDEGDSSLDSLSGHHDHTEGVGPLVSGPLPFSPTFDGRGASSTEGSAFLPFPSASHLQPPISPHRDIEFDHLHFSQTLPHTPSASTDVTRDTSRMLAPLSDDHPFPSTRPFSWPESYSGESGDHEAFLATMAIRGSTLDSGTATTFSPLELRSMAHTYSAVHPPDWTLDGYSPVDPYSTHDEAAPSLEHQVHQPANTVAFTTPPSGRVSARRNSKKYRCDIQGCTSAFAQRQGLNRHTKDKHSSLKPCLYCSDFEWSEGRSYLFKKHLKKMHPGAPLP
ncbi:hypothetical protein EDB85DRAFT_1274916 [Lactarius pseudohatsudake]|nr:hypothetical protein EDB85DRAFT_1274564 [Lactarius pseudohatsudake]KAH9032163.1 hypothetical protein EDB85DRAFT_1274916 [Lactarius pseudohatsudake]